MNAIEILNVSSIAKHGHSPLSPSEQTIFRSLVGLLNWLVQGTRPELAFPLLELSSKMQNANFDALKQVVKVLTRLRYDPGVIVVPNIGFDVTSWRIVLYSDAAYANPSDGVSSTYGLLVFLVGSSGCALISWRAGKIHRVVRSTLAAETLALVEGFKEALYVRNILNELFPSVTIPIHAIVDSKSLVEASHSTKSVDDRRLRVDLACKL